ncbi:MAG: diguanylate cyclase [Pseudomonadales bacterium]|nr:diguanylate cyclase [Pseudomonadales bacterium]
MPQADIEKSPTPNLDEDLISNFRLQFNFYFGLTTFLFLSPFTVNHIITGRFIMAAFTGVITAIAAINSISIFRRKVQPIPFVYHYVFILITLVSGLYLQGESIIYWYYPFAFIVFSSAEHRQARIMLFVSFALLVPTAFYMVEQPTAWRFAVTYLMVCLLGDLVVGLLDKAQRQQAMIAVTDPLTGALNRRSLLTHLDDAAAACQRGLGTASLLTIDIDHFKKINDTHGHMAGDEALKAVVDTLIQRKRQLDKLFRTGGEEFIMLARDLDKEGSIIFSDNLRAAVEQSNILDGKPVTVSIGVASYEQGESIDDWIRRADDHMYLAKRHGRNCVSPHYVPSSARAEPS